VSDREVTLEKVRAFISKLELVGEKFLGKYLVATTSGTTGTPGISWALQSRCGTNANCGGASWIGRRRPPHVYGIFESCLRTKNVQQGPIYLKIKRRVLAAVGEMLRASVRLLPA
jgi:hypothetical protein